MDVWDCLLISMRLKKEMMLEIIALRYIQWASIEHRFDRSIISMRLKRDEGGDVIFFWNVVIWSISLMNMIVFMINLIEIICCLVTELYGLA